MKATIEGYTFNFPTATSIIQLDDPQYHSSSAMKAVDVVAELPNHRIFVEIKNYEEHKEWFEKDPCNDPKNRLSKIRFDIIYKYRDSFLYYWCSKAPEKENIYVFLTGLVRCGHSSAFPSDYGCSFPRKLSTVKISICMGADFCEWLLCRKQISMEPRKAI